MSVFVDKHSRVIIQGFTGEHSTFHAEEAIKHGTTIVGGVTPGKGATTHIGLPVFDTVADAVKETGADVSGVFVPPPFAADAVLEAVDAGIKCVVVITDGIPVHDMVREQRWRVGHEAWVIGPNTPGVISPGECKVGIMPSDIFKPGRVGVVSRSGTLIYEAVEQMVALGLGQTTCIGIGGDPVVGLDFETALKAFEQDPDTDVVLMIGEVGGNHEVTAAQWAKQNMSKPLISYIAGTSAPPRRRMGHAGAIITGQSETAYAKTDTMEELGVYVSRDPACIGEKVLQAMNDSGIKP